MLLELRHISFHKGRVVHLLDLDDFFARMTELDKECVFIGPLQIKGSVACGDSIDSRPPSVNIMN